MDYNSEFELPVVNLKEQNHEIGSSSWTEKCKFVTESMEKYGFVVAIHDELSEELNDKMYLELKGLFDLPSEVKTKYQTEIPYINYLGPLPYKPLTEAFGFDDATNNIEQYEAFANLMWPSGNQIFCETIHSYSMGLAKLNAVVTQMIFVSYGVEKYYESLQESLSHMLRLNKYNAPQEGERPVGAPPHTDKGFTTVLTQHGVDALEVQLKNGKWVSVHFPPSSAVIVADDLLLAWSNGRVKPAYHRVILNGTEPRYSVVQFAFVDTKLQAPKEFIDDEHPQLYHPLTSTELLHFSMTEEGQRAPDVLQAFCGV